MLVHAVLDGRREELRLSLPAIVISNTDWLHIQRITSAHRPVAATADPAPHELDEETVPLVEHQRLMLNQTILDSQREQLLHRLVNPSPSTNDYSYNASQALTK
ncbi:hypothetical protein M409DRAFT_30974 [Zasmidium cellare ATCC 36951]|uniref:Uncharacterized protein n=1 Tax=Zasmidium cellare ATCC 36951 TaxID=1080233 RepID=A0A6A6BUR7_ZASCE|nr:uncharacterized protein M409DRAFT_30974 [Zasmidium cellare ATCC 36951]KAF2158537.1 hypothetical protein M409DRAFT_30974 [Zasmidium cellare ATCC 36951]